jgi:hypothetical protein
MSGVGMPVDAHFRTDGQASQDYPHGRPSSICSPPSCWISGQRSISFSLRYSTCPASFHSFITRAALRRDTGAAGNPRLVVADGVKKRLHSRMLNVRGPVIP